MSDEDEVQYVKRQKVVHYGSLEESERAKLEQASSDSEDGGDEKAPASNVFKSSEYMTLEDHVAADKQATLDELQRKKRALMMAVTTDDKEVRRKLRQLGQPVTLFGEGPADRRNRLKELLSYFGPDAVAKRQEEEEEKGKDRFQAETWYHEGPESLQSSRVWLAQYSLPRARERLANAKAELEIPDATRTARRQEMVRRMRSMNISCSQVGDTRPVSFCEFSPNSQMLVTGSWSGLCKLWSVPDCNAIRTLRGHTCNVGAIVFHPKATISLEPSELSLASCSADGAVKLWNLENDEPIANMEGHAPHRVSRVAFHPSGRFLATCVFDASWRLWDLEQGEEVLHQEGHSKPVYTIAFQSDGSVAVTGGLDSFGRVWDLRTGRCIMFLEGHLKGILSTDFSPDGYHIVTGSEDNSCKIWDLRKRNCVYTIPAHNNLVSGVKFEKSSGQYVVSCSYDSTVKIWASKTWQPLKTLTGHDSKVMAVDIAPDGSCIASASFDRTYKLWAPE